MGRFAGVGEYIRKSDSINVKSEGAVGDSATYNDSALRKVIRAIGTGAYKSIYFPAGEYIFAKPIWIPKGISIIGDGPASKITQMANEPTFRFEALSQFGRLNGTTLYYSAGDVLDADTGDLSLSIRIKLDSTTLNQQTLIAKATSTTSQGYMLYIENGYLKAMISDGVDTFVIIGTTLLNQGALYHIAVVFDRDNAANSKIYLDGTNDTASQTGTIGNVGTIANSGAFCVGAESDGENKADVYVTDSRVYIGGVWSAANVLAQYETWQDKTLGGTYTSYWYFDEAWSETDIDDQVGSNNLAFMGPSAPYWFGSGSPQTLPAHSLSIDSNVFYYLYIGDMYLYSFATTKALLDLTMVHMSTFNNIVMRGGYYGILAKGCLGCTFNDIRVDSSSTGNPIDYLLYATAYGTMKSNVMSVYGMRARAGAGNCLNGIYYNGGGQGNITVIGSIFEGTTGTGIELVSCVQGNVIEGCHFEGSGTQAVKISSCGTTAITGCYLNATKSVYIRSSYGIAIRNSYVAGSPDIDASNTNCTIEQSLIVADMPLLDTTACRVSGLSYSGFARKFPSYSSSAYSPNNLVAGNLETWSAGLPVGFTKIGGTETLAEETTIIRFGSKSCKVTNGAATAHYGIKYSLSGTAYKNMAFPDATNYVGQNWSWTTSGIGTNNFYLKTAGGADPALPSKPIAVLINGISRTEGNGATGLAENEWDYGDFNSLGYSTIYVRIPVQSGPSYDPDAAAIGYIEGVYKRRFLTASAWFYKPNTASGNGVNPSIAKYSAVAGLEQSVCSLVSEQWQRHIVKLALDERDSAMDVYFGLYNGAANGIFYVDGIEIREGDQVSPTFCE